MQLAKPFFSEERIDLITADIEAILASGQFMLGEWCASFEQKFSGYQNKNHSIAVNSCTTALQITLEFLKERVGSGSVLVPDAGFLSNVSTIKWAGLKPIFVDIKPSTLSFDLDDLNNKIRPDTIGIVWVHLTGWISDDATQILDFADENGLFVIEDCAHAQGSTLDSTPAGSLGDAGCFSFFPSKILTTGSGGMITTDDAELDEFAREKRIFGRSVSHSGEIVREGNDWFLDEVRSCIGYHQMDDLAFNLARRREVAAIYEAKFLSEQKLETLKGGCLSAFYQYPIFLKNIDTRDRLSQRLKSDLGIPSKRIYQPLHREAIFSGLGLNEKDFRGAADALDRSLCVPIHANVSASDANHIADCVLISLNRL